MRCKQYNSVMVIAVVIVSIYLSGCGRYKKVDGNGTEKQRYDKKTEDGHGVPAGYNGSFAFHG